MSYTALGVPLASCGSDADCDAGELCCDGYCRVGADIEAYCPTPAGCPPGMEYSIEVGECLLKEPTPAPRPGVPAASLPAAAVAATPLTTWVLIGSVIAVGAYLLGSK